MKINRLNKKAILIGSLIILTLLLQLSFVAAAEFPRGLHLSWQNDPATTMTLMWRSEPGAEGVMEYGKDLEYTHSIESETHVYRYGRTDIYWHTVELTGLEPNTTYHYRVKTSEPWASENYTFKTAVPKGEDTPFKFAVISDVHGSYDNQKKVLEMIREENVDFILSLGDLTDTGNQSEWDQWFFASEGLLGETPFLSVHGNHEGNQKTYWEQFAFPGNERWFSIDYGNVHFVFLMTATEPLTLEQRPWILEDLQQNNNTWTIAMGHMPVYSAGLHHGSSPYLIEHWADIFEEYAVDAYFGGHNHCYDRGWPIKEGRLDSEGVVYITHGPVGEKLYGVAEEWWSAKVAENISMYSVYSVEGLQIKGTAKRLDGLVIDEFVLDRPSL